jgi:hypothetical protein
VRIPGGKVEPSPSPIRDYNGCPMSEDILVLFQHSEFSIQNSPDTPYRNTLDPIPSIWALADATGSVTGAARDFAHGG